MEARFIHRTVNNFCPTCRGHSDKQKLFYLDFSLNDFTFDLDFSYLNDRRQHIHRLEFRFIHLQYSY